MARNNDDIKERGKHTRFKKGQSGNPKGKKRGTRSIKTTLRKLLSREINLQNPLKLNDKGEPENELASLQEHLCNALIVKAINGDVKAFEAIVNRLEGMPDQTVTGKFKIDNRLALEQLKKAFEKKNKTDGKEKGE